MKSPQSLHVGSGVVVGLKVQGIILMQNRKSTDRQKGRREMAVV